MDSTDRKDAADQAIRHDQTERRVLPRRPGAWKGRMWMGADFEAPLPKGLQRLFGRRDD